MTLAQQAVVVLRDAGVMLDPGLGEGDIDDVEARYGIRFGDDHRALLALVVPIGPNWVDWRHDDDADVRRRLAWPHDSAVWHVQHTLKDWPRSWGQRPKSDDEIETVARRHLARWHPLIPVWGHRYLPGAPAPAGSPVFSVYQIDVSLYGVDLVDYFHHELHPRSTRARRSAQHTYHPWSRLAYDLEPADL